MSWRRSARPRLVPALGLVPYRGVGQPGDDYEAGPFAERILNAKGMGLMNQVAWTVAEITCVVGHPEDADYLILCRSETHRCCS